MMRDLNLPGGELCVWVKKMIEKVGEKKGFFIISSQAPWQLSIEGRRDFMISTQSTFISKLHKILCLDFVFR